MTQLEGVYSLFITACKIHVKDREMEIGSTQLENSCLLRYTTALKFLVNASLYCQCLTLIAKLNMILKHLFPKYCDCVLSIFTVILESCLISSIISSLFY